MLSSQSSESHQTAPIDPGDSTKSQLFYRSDDDQSDSTGEAENNRLVYSHS